MHLQLQVIVEGVMEDLRHAAVTVGPGMISRHPLAVADQTETRYIEYGEY